MLVIPLLLVIGLFSVLFFFIDQGWWVKIKPHINWRAMSAWFKR
jgi:hypothetical protein